MTQPTPEKFTVAYGRTARTLEYSDQRGQLIFTVDLTGSGPNSFYLEHWTDRSERDGRYAIAYERAKAYIESCGYNVQEYGA